MGNYLKLLFAMRKFIHESHGLLHKTCAFIINNVNGVQGRIQGLFGHSVFLWQSDKTWGGRHSHTPKWQQHKMRQWNLILLKKRFSVFQLRYFLFVNFLCCFSGKYNYLFELGGKFQQFFWVPIVVECYQSRPGYVPGIMRIGPC